MMVYEGMVKDMHEVIGFQNAPCGLSQVMLDCRVQTREMISVPWIHVVRIGKYFKGNHHTEATALLWLRVKSLRINNRKASSPSFANMFVNAPNQQNGF